MGRLYGFAAALAVGASFAPVAAAAPKTSRQMRCRELQAMVARAGRYYKDTADGPVPIYGLLPLSGNPFCSARFRLFYLREQTLDQAACHIGYLCIAN